MLRRAVGAIRSRTRVLAVMASVAFAIRVASPAPAERTAAGVAELLGRAVGGHVDPDEFVWESRPSAIGEAIFGRAVLFLAGPNEGSARDLYRARVRLSRSGRPLAVLSAHNLSETPLDDDRDLVARGDHAAVSMVSADGSVLGVRVLDLAGDGSKGARRAIESWLESGSTKGLGCAEIAFKTPPKGLRFELADDALVLAVGEESEPARLDLATYELNAGPRNAAGASVSRLPPPIRSLARLLGRAAGLSGLDDLALRFAHAKNMLSPRARAPVFDGPALADPGSSAFPPAPVALAGSADADGRFHAVRSVEESASAPWLAESAVRAASGAVVRLVAIDTRQLDFGLVGGLALPKPLAGPHADGRLPTSGLVAVFDAPAWSDREGFRAAGRDIVATPPDSPALAVSPFGALALFTNAGSQQAQAWPWLVETRSLVGDESARGSSCEGCRVERSALCVLSSGSVLYAWSRAADVASMRSALAAARCAGAVVLNAHPAPAGFALASSEGRLERLVDPAMSLVWPSQDEPAVQPLFYLSRRDSKPNVSPSAAATWTADPGIQPSPSFRPGIHTATIDNLGAHVRVLSIAPGRVSYRLRAGAKEVASARTGVTFPAKLDDSDVARVVAAVGLGTGRRKGPSGLAIDGRLGLAMRGEDAGILTANGSSIRIADAKSAPPATDGDTSELPLTAEAGQLLSRGREIGTMRARGAACTLDDGTLLVARATFDSDEATTTSLLELGCQTVVALDRGSHLPTFVRREPPKGDARDDGTVLFALDSEMRGRATVMP